MNNRGSETAEVWLRGNLRPVAALAAVAAAIVAGLACVAAWADPVGGWLPVVAAIGGGTAGVVALLAAAASRPRLACTHDSLRVRLSPTRVESVPLDVAECFFSGSNPVTRGGEQTCEHHAAFRVNTLVLRLAERAADYRTRPTFTPWGTWDEGYVVFDGRWCEPLSPELARQIGRRLVEAKRAAAVAGGGAP